MEAGEKELRKTFEEVTTNNVRAAVAHSNETRKIVRDLEQRVIALDGLVRNYESVIETLRNQIVFLQTKVFSGGTQ